MNWESALIPTATWRDNIQSLLEVYTALTTSADAAALNSLIISELDRPIISFSVDALLFNIQAGDVVYLNRTRFPSVNGTASNALMLVLEIGKDFANRSTTIKGELL